MDFEWSLSFPSNVLIVGPSGCGKTSFIEKLLETSGIWEKPIDKLYYCYGINTDNVKTITKKFPDATIIEGLPLKNRETRRNV